MTPTLDNIERVPPLPPDALDRRYLRTGTPVILTGLFDRAPVHRLADTRVARAELAHLPLAVRPHPLTEFLHGRGRPPERTVSFGAFYDELAAGVDPRDLCIEYETPPAVAAYAPPPPYVTLGDPLDVWTSFLFMAGPGTATHLHYDIDRRAFLMYQVFGHKRYVVIDPREAGKVAPGPHAHLPYMSHLSLQDFPRADLTAFLRYTNAWDCVLGPGETLVVPAHAWHYVEYLDVALSMTFRLPRSLALRPRAVPPSQALRF